MLCLTKESVITATLVHAPVCVCVRAPRTPHGGPSALEISSGGGSGLNSLPVRIRTGVRTLRSPALEYSVEISRIEIVCVCVCVFVQFHCASSVKEMINKYHNTVIKLCILLYRVYFIIYIWFSIM